MRFRPLGLALALAALPALAFAQSSPPPAKGAAAGGTSREDYIKRAEQRAAARFDRMDTDHDGILTREETQAYRASHHRHRRAKAAKPSPSSEPAPEKQQ